MLRARRPRRPVASLTVRALIGGTLMLGSIGSCELPKPQLPSIGSATADGGPGPRGAAVDGGPAGAAGAAIRAGSAALVPLDPS
jgi:hypothetical protein